MEKEIGIPLSSLDQRCSEDHLRNISSFLDWRKVAPYLGVSEVEVEEIDFDRETEYDRRLKTLQMWKSSWDYMATFKTLVLALLKVGNAYQAEKVCRLVPQVHTGISEYVLHDQHYSQWIVLTRNTQA